MKVQTTRGNPSKAVLAALGTARIEWGGQPSQIVRFTHGTTAATNAALERRGAQIGLITTARFRDVLEIGRQMRRQMCDGVLEPQTPVLLAPGRYCKEVRERISATEGVIVPLNEASMRTALAALAARGVEAIAAPTMAAWGRSATTTCWLMM
jgi:N-methylhydantoinase A/oxoprolinase/acetone carboxylase beta subunit